MNKDKDYLAPRNLKDTRLSSIIHINLIFDKGIIINSLKRPLPVDDPAMRLLSAEEHHLAGV